MDLSAPLRGDEDEDEDDMALRLDNDRALEDGREKRECVGWSPRG